jgi:hypothetical protein
MLLCNLNQTAGLCNGTWMLVTEAGHRVLKCVVLTPFGVDEEVFCNAPNFAVEFFLFFTRQNSGVTFPFSFSPR